MESYQPGQFVKINWWVGQVRDVAVSAQAFELESIYYLAYHTTSRQWVSIDEHVKIARISREEAIPYIEQRDFSCITDILDDLNHLEQQWQMHDVPLEPFPQVGQFVKVCEWCGRIRDVGHAFNRSFLVIESPKLLSRSSGEYEIIEVKPKANYRYMQAIPKQDALAEIPRYRHDVQTRIQYAQEILMRWKHGD